VKDKPVKLDSELKRRIDKFISKSDNRFEYPSIKNFIDRAVLLMLKEVENAKK
jgi:hypothetical protein